MIFENNAKELSVTNNQLALEYFKRFTASISLGSGAGLAALLSFTSVYQGKESIYLSNIVPSLWGFVVALIFSGITPYFLYLHFSKTGEALRQNHNNNELKKALLDNGVQKSVIDKIIPNKHHEDENANWFWSNIWWASSRFTLFISGSSFLAALIYPIWRVTFKGTLI